jgi:hypothetical protein
VDPTDVTRAAIALLDDALTLLDRNNCGQIAALHVCHAINLLRAGIDAPTGSKLSEQLSQLLGHRGCE